MDKPTRFVGIDLCRGLAAFAVVLIHSGDETWGIPVSEAAIELRNPFYFAVPFFLATSFYFTLRNKSSQISNSFWKKKIKRLLIPYLVWSFIYFLCKLLVYTVSYDLGARSALMSDPIAIIFFGKASYHLYFIPLLFAGLSLVYLAKFISNKCNNLKVLSLLSIASLILYHVLIASNNQYHIPHYVAFTNFSSNMPLESPDIPFFRILFVLIAWIIRCLPYCLFALLIVRLQNKLADDFFESKKILLLLFIIFIAINTIGQDYFSEAIVEIGLAFSLLLMGIAVSCYIKESRLIYNLGFSSFGIYLIHPFIIGILEIVFQATVPQVFSRISVLSILIYSISSFLISWILVNFVFRNKLLSKFI